LEYKEEVGVCVFKHRNFIV